MGPEDDGPEATPLFDTYLPPDRPNPGAYDETFSSDASIRPQYRALHEAIAPARCRRRTPRSSRP